MFDILMCNKKVILIKEIETFEHDIITHYFISRKVVFNPIEHAIINLENSLILKNKELIQQSSKLILKSLANSPELFNTIKIKEKRGVLCSN